MKYGLKMLALGLVASGFMAASFAVEKNTKYEAVKQKIQNVLGFQVLSIGDSPIDGLVQVSTNRGLFYTSDDGKFLVSGKIFNVEKGMRDETESSLAKMRIEGLGEFKDTYIEFTAPEEKYIVNVFTDITCGYCRKLHREMDEYMANGITVRYFAFPRGGVNSKSYRDMVSVWCADDQQHAMTIAKTGGTVEKSNCANAVAQQYEFGQQVGVTGTPNIVLPNGAMIPGYQPARDLRNALDQI
ncbi:bifunctional protein-disulfide isomerase/oxidoreductase DsbC [Aliiglaciecola litoralis]|uniref:Thiol:disulfide interchange protein n=1 Tax=Aliiglaciecola litoralis TaxID=582857 RepID=A0ABP3X060_9ALTE